MVLILMVFKQDRTGKIVFKLLDKDPSQLPGTLRSEVIISGHTLIYNVIGCFCLSAHSRDCLSFITDL